MAHDDRLSNIFGTFSILFWLGAQFPQVIVNIQTQSVEGLALPFLANWLFGDISNLLGCILTHQLPFQTYLAAYFCFVDFSLLAQYLYYYKPPPSLSPSEASSPISSSTPLLEDGLVHSVTDWYGSTRPRRFSGVSASYPPAGLLPGSGDPPTYTHHPKSRSRSCARARSSTLSKRATLQELQTTAANIAQAAESLLHRQHDHQRPRSASYVGDSRPSAPSRTGTGVTMSRPRFGEPKDDTEDGEVDLLAESFYSEAGGSHPRHRAIAWKTTQPSSFSQPQPIEQREVVNTYDESEDASLNGGTHDASLRQRSRSRGRPTTRHLFESTPLETVPGSYLDSPAESSAVQRGEASVTLKRPHTSVSGSRASGKRGAGIVFLSVGVGALFVLGTHTGVSKEVGKSRTNEMRRENGQVIGVGQGYLVEDEDNRAMSNDYTDDYTTSVYLSYTNIDAGPILPPHHRHERPERTKEEKRRILGRIAAWTCTTLYLTSRLPQIWKNFTRKSVRGLSLSLFAFAFFGNLFYVLSILTSPVLSSAPAAQLPFPEALTTVPPLLPSPFAEVVPPKTGWTSPAGRAFLRESLPYLLGSGGTLTFDIIIVSQGLYYRRRERRLEEEPSEDEEHEEVREAEREPLLTGAESHH